MGVDVVVGGGAVSGENQKTAKLDGNPSKMHGTACTIVENQKSAKSKEKQRKGKEQLHKAKKKQTKT